MGSGRGGGRWLQDSVPFILKLLAPKKRKDRTEHGLADASFLVSSLFFCATLLTWPGFLCPFFFSPMSQILRREKAPAFRMFPSMCSNVRNTAFLCRRQLKKKKRRRHHQTPPPLPPAPTQEFFLLTLNERISFPRYLGWSWGDWTPPCPPALSPCLPPLRCRVQVRSPVPPPKVVAKPPPLNQTTRSTAQAKAERGKAPRRGEGGEGGRTRLPKQLGNKAPVKCAVVSALVVIVLVRKNVMEVARQQMSRKTGKERAARLL